jgi:hypothetical protein
MEFDLQSFFGLRVPSCMYSLAELRPRNPPTLPPHFGLYTRALLVSQDRRHLYVTPLGLAELQLQHPWVQSQKPPTQWNLKAVDETVPGIKLKILSSQK